ncbi:hypothetical protein Tco_0617607 [Tanacetum coccineum]
MAEIHEALDLAIRLKALDEGYQFLTDRSAPERKNEGTVTRIKTDEKGVFEMLFIALGASIRTFVNYLRPLLIIDAAHLKGQYKGTNLIVVGMDGNNQIMPIAFGDNSNLLFISDRHVAIALAVQIEFPLAYHAEATVVNVNRRSIVDNGGQEDCNPENVRLSVLAKLQEALDEEDILADQILTMMHRYADRFTNRRVEINNLMVLEDHPLVDYGKYALGCMTGDDMKKCVYLKSVRDELLRSMERDKKVEGKLLRHVV